MVTPTGSSRVYRLVQPDTVDVPPRSRSTRHRAVPGFPAPLPSTFRHGPPAFGRCERPALMCGESAAFGGLGCSCRAFQPKCRPVALARRYFEARPAQKSPEFAKAPGSLGGATASYRLARSAKTNGIVPTRKPPLLYIYTSCALPPYGTASGAARHKPVARSTQMARMQETPGA